MINIYDAIKERETQANILQAQISTLQAEIEALRIAIRILEGGNIGISQTVPAAIMQAAGNSSAEKIGVWP